MLKRLRSGGQREYDSASPADALSHGNFFGSFSRLWTLGLGLGLGLGTVVLHQTIAPPLVQAYQAHVTLTVDHRDGETYDQLMRRAEAVARAGAQRSFDNDLLVAEVVVVVNGNNDGLEAPLLTLNVSRYQWRNRPDTRAWATYYPTTVELLALDDLPPPSEPAPPEPVLGTGDVQTTLRWATVDDLDLWVTDPAGDTAFYGNPSIPSGGTLDVDANAGCGSENTNPVENIFWPTDGAPSGNYVVEVRLFDRCTGASESIEFTLRILVKGEEQTLSGSVNEAQSVVQFPFTVP